MDQLIVRLLTPSCGITFNENSCQDYQVQILIQEFGSMMNSETLNVSYSTPYGIYTPLEAAVIAASPLMVRFMIMNGANPNVSSINVPLAVRIQNEVPDWRRNPRLTEIMNLLWGNWGNWYGWEPRRHHKCNSCRR